MKIFRSALIALVAGLSLTAAQPSVGQAAPDFTLNSVEGKLVRFSELTGGPTTALVVLRGYPGYQCPYCQRQVRDFAQRAQAFAEAGVKVVFVYPGPPGRASEAVADKTFPASMTMLVDTDYEFTNLYGLRWDAANETAYPSSFLIDAKGTIFYAKIVKLHGGRSTATELLEVLPKKAAR